MKSNSCQGTQYASARAMLVALAPLLVVSCGATPPATPDLDERGSNLYEGSGVVLWTQNDSYMPVCWDMTQLPGYADVNSAQLVTWRQMIKDSVMRSWPAMSAVRIGGWNACPTTGTSQFIRIQLLQAPNPSAGDNGGGAVALGMAAQVTPSSVTPSCPLDGGVCLQPSIRIDLTTSTSLGRLEYLGRHEIGHVLGFAHEQNRPDNPDPTGCVPTDGDRSGLLLTPYDQNSIMHYCQAIGGGTGALTTMDVQGLRIVYGFPRVDVDGDGKSDILWHNNGTGETQVWYMDGAVRTNFASLSSSLNVDNHDGWTLAAASDFNLDGKPDLLWRNGVTGATQLWYMNGTARTSFADVDPSLNVADSTGWRVVGVSDFDSDGKTDILWHNGTTGATLVWYMDGHSRLSFAYLPITLNIADSSGWRIAGVGDFNRDGKADILWHSGTTGESQIWYMNGVSRDSFVNLAPSLNVADSTGWRINGVSDFNRDGKVDILWHSGTTGESQIWYMDNAARSSFVAFASTLNVADSTGWTLVGR